MVKELIGNGCHLFGTYIEWVYKMLTEMPNC